MTANPPFRSGRSVLNPDQRVAAGKVFCCLPKPAALSRLCYRPTCLSEKGIVFKVNVLFADIIPKKVRSMKTTILVNQSVAILCDGNNIERSIHEQSGNISSMINFDTIIPKLLSNRGLNRLIYFREGKNISSKLAERLHNYFYGSVVPCHKSADIPLSIKATQLASKVDTIIIMSGDSDYVELVRHLKSEGVRVEIAAVEQTTARILIEEADYFHPITKEDWFVFSPKMPLRRYVAKKNHPSDEPVPA